jgi:hypothetical protein
MMLFLLTSWLLALRLLQTNTVARRVITLIAVGLLL